MKDKIFNINDSVEDTIIYDGNKFKKYDKQPKSYPQIINYRCIYKRKNEHIKNTYFCHAIVKRITENKKFYFKLSKKHSEEFINLFINKIKNISNIIGNYNDFIEKRQNYLNNQKLYDKAVFKAILLKIYNEHKYNFKLKEYTLENIIRKWKSSSIKFTKYQAIENGENEEGKLILWDYETTILYLSNKKKPILCEYFIWSYDSIIARLRQSYY